MTVFKAYPRPLWPSRGRRPTRPVRINIINFVILFCSIISHTECLLQRTNLIPDEGNRLNEDYPESHNSIADIHHHDGYQEQEGEDDDEGGLFEDVHQGVNFTNILRTAFFIPKCFAQLFCTHSFAFVIFYGKNIDAKAARKMLMK